MVDELKKAVDHAVRKMKKQHEAIFSATEKLKLNSQSQHNPYLFDSVQDFLASFSFNGSHSVKMHHHFDQWLYIGAYKAFSKREIEEGGIDMKLKIGYTTNIRQREVSLNSDTHYKLKMVYSWPIANAQLFETQILRYLKHFIHKDAFLDDRKIESSEVIWSLDLITVVRVIQLLILKYAILYDFIQCDQSLKILFKNFMVSAPTGIQYRKKSRFALFIYKDVAVDIDDLFLQLQRLNISFDDRGFYIKVLKNWRVNSFDSQLTSDIYFDGNKPNELGLSINDNTFGYYEGKTYPIKILGFGIGPYEGSFYIEWLPYKNIKDPTPGPRSSNQSNEQQFLKPEDIRLNLNKANKFQFKLRI